MPRSLPWIAVGLALVIGIASYTVGRAERRMNAGLAGARTVVEAQYYSTLQAAFDALPEEGGVVQLPPGEFEIDKPLLLSKGDVLLRGSGPATHIVNKNTKGEPALVIRHAKLDPAKPDRKLSLWRIQLSNFRITGNERSGHGIAAHYINEIYLEGVTVSYHGKHGVLLDYCYEDPRVSDSLLTYNKGSGLEIVGCHDIVVCGNHFEENLDGLRCLDAFNLCMTGNNVDDHLRHGVVIENTYGSVLSGNMIEECQDTGIILDRDCYGVTISANVIAHEMKCGIDLRDAHGCAVTGNSFPLVHDRSLVVAKASGRIPIVGNAFGDSYLGEGKTRRPPQDDPSGGLVIDGARDVIAVGNTFTGLSTEAIAQPTPGENLVLEHNLEAANSSDPDAAPSK
jgi:hypothetical protein